MEREYCNLKKMPRMGTRPTVHHHGSRIQKSKNFRKLISQKSTLKPWTQKQKEAHT
jgi:hypothetical protein